MNNLRRIKAIDAVHYLLLASWPLVLVVMYRGPIWSVLASALFFASVCFLILQLRGVQGVYTFVFAENSPIWILKLPLALLWLLRHNPRITKHVGFHWTTKES